MTTNPQFVLADTIFTVFLVDGMESQSLLIKREDKQVGVAVFTEELLAERYRDSWNPHAEIHRLTHDDLVYYLQKFRDLQGVHHVAIDPFPETGEAAWIPSQQIIAEFEEAR